MVKFWGNKIKIAHMWKGKSRKIAVWMHRDRGYVACNNKNGSDIFYIG